MKIPCLPLKGATAIVLLMLTLSLHRAAAQVTAIPDTVTLDARRISLSDLVSALQASTSYTFAYDKALLSTVYVQNIHWRQLPLGRALRELQSQAPLEYTLLDHNIAISLKKPEPPKKVTLKGRVVDYQTAQPLAGASVTLSETGAGVVTDEKGYYIIRDIPEGTYTLTVTYVGYQKAYEPGLRIPAGGRVEDVKMEAGKALDEVVVSGGFRHVKSVANTSERDLLAEVRNETGVVSGISSELIARTPDRNAAEVMKRVSGITVVDNRFVVVRGMNERYNLTYLNDNLAPSTELYTKAFAYDLLPSSIIDRILVYKSPRADLNGEFAGAAIKVYTKNAVPVKHFDMGVQLADRPGSTLATVNTYSGGRLDWLGFDDGTRKLPSFSPGYFQTNQSAGNLSYADMVKAFSPTLTYGTHTSTPDMQLFANYYNSWKLGRMTRLFDLTSVTYTKETTNYTVHRQGGNTDAFIASGGDLNIGPNNYLQQSLQTTEIGKINVLENLTFKTGSHTTIQLKNFFVNDGRKFTGINTTQMNILPVYDSLYSNNRKKDIILSFQDRMLYSGNLEGNHTWGRSALDWNLGYSYDQQNVPDQRISHFESAFSNPNGGKDAPDLVYTAAGSNMGDYDDGFLGMIQRLFVKNKESVYDASLDYTLHLGNAFDIKAGTFQMFKSRDVGRRFFRVNRGGLAPTEVNVPGNQGVTDGWPQGYGVSNPSIIYFRLQDLGSIWNPANFPSDGSGLGLYDGTTPADHYVASEQNNSFYVMGDWGLMHQVLTLNAGVRLEYDCQKLTGAQAGADGGINVVYIDHPKTSVLPSVNLTFRPDSSWVGRLAYGRTVNRPEFRELTPYDDFDFINNEEIVGNPNVVPATIDNYDVRLELYPKSAAAGEVFDVGVFYKHLQDPIERLRSERSGYTDGSAFTAITFSNAQSAEVYGLEAEVKKSLSFFGGAFFRRMSLVVNGALIKARHGSTPTRMAGTSTPAWWCRAAPSRDRRPIS